MDQSQIETLYALSPTQQGMLFHTLYAPQTGVYLIQFPYQLAGDLDVPDFKKAWQLLSERHDILRTDFHWEDLTNPIQVVHKQVSLSVHEEDWRSLSPDEQAIKLEEYLQEDRDKGFDLSEAPLWRLHLIQTKENHYHFICTIHHMLIDGWSWAILLKEVFTFYSGLQQQQPVHLPASRPYQDYIAWLQSRDMAEAELYWQRTLAGYNVPLVLPLSKASRHLIHNPNANYQEYQFSLSSQVTTQLEGAAQNQKVTLNTILEAAWALLLSRYSGQKDILFGITTSGRPTSLEGSDQMVGLFINTLPLRVHCQAKNTVSDFLKQVQNAQSQVQQYEYSPLAQVHSWSEIPSGTPLFESILVFENFQQTQSSKKQRERLGLQVIGAQSMERTNYPLTLIILPGSTLTLKVIYDEDYFGRDAIVQIFNHLQQLLERIINCPQERLAHFSLLTSGERERVLNQWNNTIQPYPEDLLLHELIEIQVNKTPESVALSGNEGQLSYSQLNQRATQLAHHLQKQGIGPDTPVGLCLDRSHTMLIGLLAILKAGAAFLPLDPTHPKERLNYILDHSKTKVILSDREELSFATDGYQIENISCWTNYAQYPSSPLTNHKISPQNLAYIIYTSGSTGHPKGVQIPHRAVINFLTAMQQILPLSAADKWLAITTISFDIAILEVLLPLTVGAQIRIASDEETVDPRALLNLLHDEAVTHMQATPVTWQLLLEVGWQGGHPHTVLCGGEALPPSLAQQILQQNVALWNLYGPTETTIWSTAVSLETIKAEASSVTIGQPISNTQVYILDDYLYPVPVGVPGNLYIGGDGLGRGYLNNPVLTATSFIPNLFSENGCRLYRTGDIACYTHEGQIKFLGRSDFQVKIRGHRIELGEIENTLNQHPQIGQAVVVAHADKIGNYINLTAYFTSTDEVDLQSGELYAYLQNKLPHYMLPAQFVPLDSFPLTANGKIDRRALPSFTPEHTGLSNNYQAPIYALEDQIIDVWENILNVKPIGMEDNFFELGGNSLLAIRLLDQLENRIGQKITLAALFQNPTPRHLERIVRDRSWPNVLRYVGDMPSLKSPLVTVKASGSKPPLFIVAALGGVLPSNAIVGLLDMGMAVDAERPYYALQPEPMAADALALFMASSEDPGRLFSGEAPLWQPEPDTVRQTAMECIQAMQTVQPEGPYQIGGFCSGGIVAFEMAQLLETQGEEVSLLLLIDTESPAFMSEYKTVDGVNTDLDQVRSMAWFVARDIAGAASAAIDYDEFVESLTNLPPGERWPHALARLKLAGAVPQDTHFEEIRRLYMIYRVNLWTIGAVLTDYQPESVYSGPITLFRAREAYSDVEDQVLGWTQFTTEGVNVEFVPGDHGTLFRQENVGEFMEKLEPYLDNGGSK